MKTYCIYYSYKDLPHAWDALVQHDVFLQSSYLHALENASPSNIQLFYVGMFNNNVLSGVGVIQRVQLYVKDMFRNDSDGLIKASLKHILAKFLKGNILVLGNLTHTGQHGAYFNPDTISQTAYFKLIFDAFGELKKTINIQQHKKIRAILLKDFFKDGPMLKTKDVFFEHKLHQVTVQPNMIFPLPPNWKTMADYIEVLNSKYKTRYKRAKRKLGSITCSELNLEAIATHSNTLHGLYLNVSNNAAFNTFVLPQNHFYCLKEQLHERFRVFGYYIENQLVGFFTLILNYDHLETYFLGYDEEHQCTNQLYLNMLFDMVKFGIENKFSSIVYARTAMEIKSSVGAIPIPMVMYIKHTNIVINMFLKYVFRLMNPSQNWKERHPFS